MQSSRDSGDLEPSRRGTRRSSPEGAQERGEQNRRSDPDRRRGGSVDARPHSSGYRAARDRLDGRELGLGEALLTDDASSAGFSFLDDSVSCLSSVFMVSEDCEKVVVILIRGLPLEVVANFDSSFKGEQKGND